MGTFLLQEKVEASFSRFTEVVWPWFTDRIPDK